MTIDVLVELTNRNVDKTFTYLVPKNLRDKIKVGVRVLVPFSSFKLEGFVLNIKENLENDYELKEIIDVIDEEIVLTPELLELGHYL